MGRSSGMTGDDAYAILHNKMDSGGGGTGATNYNDLTNKPKINGVELSGNKTSADLGISADITQVDHGTSDTTFVLPPNQLHTWGEVTELNLLFSEGTSGRVNEYMFSFDSGATATVLTLPETVMSDLVVEANRHYEVSIVNNYLTWTSWAVTT